MAPPALWSGPRPTRSVARSRPPRAETPPLPATCRWPRSLLRSQPDQPSHDRGNASSRPFRFRSLGRALHLCSCTSRLGRCCSSPCWICCSAAASLAVNDVRRPQNRIGRSWHKAGDSRDAQIAGYRAVVEGPFEIRVSRAGCRGFDGIPAALPDNTHRVAMETSRRST